MSSATLTSLQKKYKYEYLSLLERAVKQIPACPLGQMIKAEAVNINQ